MIPPIIFISAKLCILTIQSIYYKHQPNTFDFENAIALNIIMAIAYDVILSHTFSAALGLIVLWLLKNKHNTFFDIYFVWNTNFSWKLFDYAPIGIIWGLLHNIPAYNLIVFDRHNHVDQWAITRALYLIPACVWMIFSANKY